MHYCTAVKKLLLPMLFLAVCTTGSAQQLKRAEYFFDTDPGLGKGAQLTLPSKVGVDTMFDFNLSALSTGLHFVYVRAQDTAGRWSLGYRAAFIKYAGGTAGGANYLTKAEYFFDKDPGVGKATALTISGSKTSVDSTFAFDVSALTNGLHTMYVRVQDANQNWSLGYSSWFIKQVGTDSMLTIQKMEYYLDVDPGFGKGTPMPITQAATINDTFSFSIPKNGAATRTLYVRAQDSRGNWGLVYDTTLNPATLPLLVTSFTGQYVKGGNLLSATLTDAINVKTVELQKSANGTQFTYLGDMATAPGINGTHVYTDASPYDGPNYYRLRIIDDDGNLSFSGVILLNNAAAIKATVYPNPFATDVLVQFTNATAGKYCVTITDVVGNKLQASYFTVGQGNQVVTLPLGGYASGVYFATVTDALGKIILTQKLVKQ